MYGQHLEEAEDIETLMKQGPFAQLDAIYSDDRTFETRQPMLSGDAEFGSIRIGISPYLIRGELHGRHRGAGSVVAALIIASFFAVIFAQWMLRPIHVIQSGLTRLGRGELDVSLDLPGEEFRDLGSSFEAVSAQLSAVRAKPLPAAGTDLESVMENLEDAVALFAVRRGDLHERRDEGIARRAPRPPGDEEPDRPDACGAQVTAARSPLTIESSSPAHVRTPRNASS